MSRRDLAPKARVWFSLGAVAMAAGLAGVLLWPFGSRDVHHAYALAPENALSDRLRKAPPKVREAYRFAIENRDLLTRIPCYCGCGTEHKSNADCYIKDVKPAGEVEFDLMSYG